MRKGLLAAGMFLAAGSLAVRGAGPAPDWAMNATVIEACSCPMFCQCYFNTKPAAHGAHEGHGAGHFCRANNAYKVNKGHFGSTPLDGAKFWMAGDLGGDFSKEHYDWAVLTFEPSLAKARRDATNGFTTTIDMTSKDVKK